MPSAAQPVKVLIVDADPVQRRLLAQHVAAGPSLRFRPEPLSSAAELAPAAPDQLVVADLETVGGLDSLGRLAQGRALIAISARGSVATAVEAMRAGAVDFLPKPIGAKALIARLEMALAAAPSQLAARGGTGPRARREGEDAEPETDFEGFVGCSEEMRRIYEMVDRIAGSRAPVFLTGESGSGKDVCAEAIHARGGAGRPFVALNCGALPKDLVESEIFGHVRGAFTGALADHPGAAELADGGTLFLDEIAEIVLPLQAKLLRFVQTGMVQRVGDARARKVAIRVICATNRDPAEEVAEGRFRADLYYRLNVLPIRLPSLRERPQDIAPLAEFFLTRYAAEEGVARPRLDAGAADLLLAQAWPGNVRQLQNVIRRVVVLDRSARIDAAMLRRVIEETTIEPARGAPRTDAPQQFPGQVRAGEGVAPALLPFRDQERRIIEAALEACNGSIARAAAALGINPSTIYRKRQAWQTPA